MVVIETTNIILIGPSGAGKSTVSKLLSEKLKLPTLELDELRWAYHDEIGYDKELASRIRNEQGFVALVAYWEKFTIYALERLLQDYPAGHIISTGAGAVVFDNAEYSARAQKALEPYPFVGLLLPAPDVEESIRICTARIIVENPEMQDVPGSPFSVNASFIRRRDYHDMATIKIYNNKQTPEATCAAIIQAIKAKTDS
jgi:shikimate kinase